MHTHTHIQNTLQIELFVLRRVEWPIKSISSLQHRTYATALLKIARAFSLRCKVPLAAARYSFLPFNCCVQRYKYHIQSRVDYIIFAVCFVCLGAGIAAVLMFVCVVHIYLARVRVCARVSTSTGKPNNARRTCDKETKCSQLELRWQSCLDCERKLQI